MSRASFCLGRDRDDDNGSRQRSDHGAIWGLHLQGQDATVREGQLVVFHFKRRGTDNWRRFKVGPADGRNAFFVLDHERPRDRINRRHRWAIFFTPGTKPGRWVLRAKFIHQDGFESSAVRQRVRVRRSD
jgi:hypothetical protein